MGATPIALFCATFLKPEMLHIHRHICGLRSFRPLVITQKQEGSWPCDRLEVVKRSRGRFWGRAMEKQSGRPWQISGSEVRPILTVLERESCALLHVFFGNVAIHLLPLLRRCPIPFLVSFHGSDVAGSMASAAYSDFLSELFELAALVPCRSEQLAAKVARLGCPERKTRLMRTVLPDLPFAARNPPGDGAWRILQAARLVPKKGLATAMHAFSLFHRTYPLATFQIAGAGPLEEDLRKLASDLGLEDHVEFLGFLSQAALGDLFFRSHIFLHPSEDAGGDIEGVPNAMLEAMASGLPVVATRHGGIPEVIEDEKNGLLCDEKDAKAVASALLRLANDPDLRGRISLQASVSVRERFSEERQIRAIEEIYKEAIVARSGTIFA